MTKNKALSVFTGLLFFIGNKLLLAQVAIPMANYSFTGYPSTPAPNGVSISVTTGGELYSTAGSSATIPSLKLQANNQYFQINTASTPGVVSYVIRGNIGGTATVWDGTFQVQQSVDGTDWTTLPVLKSYSGPSAMPHQGNFLAQTVTPALNARYIRWIFVNKIAGCNVALDDISIAAPAVGAGPVIIVKDNGATLINGQSYTTNTAVNTTKSITFTIQNYGSTNSLNILNSTAITGTNAGSYAITTTLPFTVAASAAGTTTQNLVVNFTPTSLGTKNAVLTINSNDVAVPSFVINLNCIGGTLASEPTTTLGNLLFTGNPYNYNKSYRLRGTFTINSGNNADGYLIVRRIGSAPATAPTDGKIYSIGDTVGLDKVIATNAFFTPLAAAPTLSFISNNISANTNYYFAIYPYNGTGSFINYKQTGALIDNVISTGSMMPTNEYANINTSNSTFVSDLTNVIDITNRTKVFYSNYAGTMMRLFAATDTFGGQKVATCVYSGDKYVYSEPLLWGYMSREHSYCHNWMPTNPADGSAASPNNVERPEYNDQHHLFPTNQNQANAVRSNNPMGEVVTVQSTFKDAKVGFNSVGQKVYEPRNEQKGITARAIMYMAVAYNGSLNAFGTVSNWSLRNPISSSIPYGQDQNILKKWNFEHPPSNWEISRNDFLDSLQGNRNPFIDHPEYACYIDFTNMSYISNPGSPCYTTTSLNNVSGNKGSIGIFPNPTNGNFDLLFNGVTTENALIKVYNITGQVVYSSSLTVNKGLNSYAIQLPSTIVNGIYTINVSSNTINHANKLVIE